DDASSALMLEPQDDLGVVVKNLVHVLDRQDRLAEIEEVLPVRLEGEEDGVVAAGHQAIGAERLPGTQERGLRAVTDDVVVEAPPGHARTLRQLRERVRRLLAEALE